MRRTPVLVAGGLLVTAAGVVLVWRGVADGPDGLTVAGILVLLGGLVCLRVAYWRVRIGAMTRAGLAMHGEDATGGRDDEQRPGSP
jgi:hypothetical protein